MRQYIGARYVPIFYEGINGSEWDSGVGYDALTIVTYLNNTYTSKIPVPATVGNPANNPTYWVATGNFNAQLQTYQEDVNILKNKSSQTERKYIFIGDSYATPDHHGGWINQVRIMKNLTQNIDYWSAAEGGACFGSGAYMTLLESVTNGLTEAQKKNITDVVIQGSVNEYTYTNTQINQAVFAVETFVEEHFPNAKLWLPLMGWSFENATIRGETLRAYNAYNETMRFGFVVNDIFKNLLNPSYFEDDCTHLNELGLYYVSWGLVNALNGGSGYVRNDTDLITTFTGINGGTITIHGNIMDRGYWIYKNDLIGLNLSAPTTIPGPSEDGLVIATATKANGNMLFMRSFTAPCMALLRKNNNTYVTAKVTISVTKVPDVNTWNMKINSNDIVGEDFPIENVEGIYIQFNQCVDMISN